MLALLDGGHKSDVRIVRIVRNGNINRFHELPPTHIAATWADHVLRYSNVLQGLFYRRVAICESDADCRSYGAALDQLAIETGRRSQADDVLLVSSGGKQRVSALASALRHVGVETHAFVDFDVLNARDSTIQGIVESLGGEWTADIAEDFVTFVDPVQQRKSWPHVKAMGLVAVPPGEPHLAAQRLLKAVGEQRVHIVPVGVMEVFDRTNTLHGSAWVSRAVGKDLHKNSEAAKELVETLLSAEITCAESCSLPDV